jgi:hypothetical protein
MPPSDEHSLNSSVAVIAMLRFGLIFEVPDVGDGAI